MNDEVSFLTTFNCMIRLTAIQYIEPGFDINRLITLTANARSSLMATIAYINDPTAS